ncbi:MAG: mannose-1-phosphate guanylyltransferase [Clostridiales Family XIII bacterium]|jgi:mannose-1-phosphate guanylyltransferase|nr:mannose-1-phosphate guanylyltransferase [Clostridiales Family XIII bacterium]
MHLILLSGGSGKRLWPLANGVRSKQFLKLLRSDDGEMESMIERVFRQLKDSKGNIKWESITVVAGKTQEDQLKMQLPFDVNILIEPDRRDTFPAISYAVAWLYNKKGVSKDDVIAIMPVDPFVSVDFFNSVAMIENEILIGNTDILLLGCKPAYPTEKYGYIIADYEKEGAERISFAVKRFIEKPSMKDAKILIEKGAFWNCGVFGMKLGLIIDILSQHYDIFNFNKSYMDKAFYSLPKISFDYEVLESANKIRMIEYDGSWEDLGTWESLTDKMDERIIGNVISDKSSVSSHIINELTTPVVALGIKDSVVIASHDGILLAAKNETHRLKDFLPDVNLRPMYEKKRWGEYFVLDYKKTEACDILTKKLIINKGKQISYQLHKHRKEVWTITSGKALLYYDGIKRELNEGVTISIAVGMKHGIYALTDIELIEIQFGNPLIEEDIIRLEMNWKV